MGDFDVAHPFHPWTYVSNQITHLFSDGIVSQEMPDVGVKVHPPIHSNIFSAHLLSIIKVFAFVIEAGSFGRVGGARNCTLGFLPLHRDFFLRKKNFVYALYNLRLILDISGM